MSGFRFSTRKEYDELRARLEAAGFTVETKWRPGLKEIRLGPVVLSQSAPAGKAAQ